MNISHDRHGGTQTEYLCDISDSSMYQQALLPLEAARRLVASYLTPLSLGCAAQVGKATLSAAADHRDKLNKETGIRAGEENASPTTLNTSVKCHF